MYSPGSCRSPIRGARPFVGSGGARRGYFEAGNHSRHATGRMYVKTVIPARLAGGVLRRPRLGRDDLVAGGSARDLDRAGDGRRSGSTSSTTAATAPTPHRRGSTRLAALSLDLLGGDSYLWHWKHNIVHHTYPNIVGRGQRHRHRRLARMSPAPDRATGSTASSTSTSGRCTGCWR